MRKKPLLIFCDFDGTVATTDIGYALFNHFSGGRNDELIPDWMAGRISTRECLLREAAMVHATPKEIHEFLDRFSLDPGFSRFVELCRRNRVDPIIVSEGLDFYIRYLLDRHGHSDLKFLSNVGRLVGDSISIEFPYVNRECRRCGSCKGERIAEYRAGVGSDCLVVFVGDGLSDACATREADVVFAKKDLEQYCLRENIRYTGFTDFFEVSTRMLEMDMLAD